MLDVFSNFIYGFLVVVGSCEGDDLFVLGDEFIYELSFSEHPLVLLPEISDFALL